MKSEVSIPKNFKVQKFPCLARDEYVVVLFIAPREGVVVLGNPLSLGLYSTYWVPITDPHWEVLPPGEKVVVSQFRAFPNSTGSELLYIYNSSGPYSGAIILKTLDGQGFTIGSTKEEVPIGVYLTNKEHWEPLPPETTVILTQE